MDDLPFADATADLVVYNASLHYSTDYQRTLAEGLRVLKPGGRLVVIETPIYGTGAAGERWWPNVTLSSSGGTAPAPSRCRPSSSSPTTCSTNWHATWACVAPHRTWYGWHWAMRPWKARWKKKRPPSRFVRARRHTGGGSGIGFAP